MLFIVICLYKNAVCINAFRTVAFGNKTEKRGKHKLSLKEQIHQKKKKRKKRKKREERKPKKKIQRILKHVSRSFFFVRKIVASIRQCGVRFRVSMSLCRKSGNVKRGQGVIIIPSKLCFTKAIGSSSSPAPICPTPGLKLVMGNTTTSPTFLA